MPLLLDDLLIDLCACFCKYSINWVSFAARCAAGDVPQRVRRGELQGAGRARRALVLVRGVPGRHDDLAVPPRAALPPAVHAAHSPHGHRRAAHQVAL